MCNKILAKVILLYPLEVVSDKFAWLCWRRVPMPANGFPLMSIEMRRISITKISGILECLSRGLQVCGQTCPAPHLGYSNKGRCLIPRAPQNYIGVFQSILLNVNLCFSSWSRGIQQNIHIPNFLTILCLSLRREFWKCIPKCEN